MACEQCALCTLGFLLPCLSRPFVTTRVSLPMPGLLRSVLRKNGSASLTLGNSAPTLRLAATQIHTHTHSHTHTYIYTRTGTDCIHSLGCMWQCVQYTRVLTEHGSALPPAAHARHMYRTPPFTAVEIQTDREVTNCTHTHTHTHTDTKARIFADTTLTRPCRSAGCARACMVCMCV